MFENSKLLLLMSWLRWGWWGRFHRLQFLHSLFVPLANNPHCIRLFSRCHLSPISYPRHCSAEDNNEMNGINVMSHFTLFTRLHWQPVAPIHRVWRLLAVEHQQKKRESESQQNWHLLDSVKGQLYFQAEDLLFGCLPFFTVFSFVSISTNLYYIFFIAWWAYWHWQRWRPHLPISKEQSQSWSEYRIEHWCWGLASHHTYRRSRTSLHKFLLLFTQSCRKSWDLLGYYLCFP